MSFLLQGKSRRSRGRHRSKVQHREVVSVSKNEASVTGGQVQIHRPQRTTIGNHSRAVSSQNNANQQVSHAKKDVMQSAGISMEQVMEDLHILEQQQHESQRKLKQTKSLKQNRIEHRTLIENKLGALRYKNGERRTQVNRARDVLSKSTREMEAVKLVASSDDDRLKDINYKLKKTMKVARTHQMYKRILDDRFQRFRGREAICERLLSRLNDKLKKSSQDVKEVTDYEKKLRHSIAEFVARTTKESENTSKLRSEVSAMAEELRSAKEMQNTTKLRAESIKLETKLNEERHADDIRSMNDRLKEIQDRKGILKAEQENTSRKLDEKLEELRDVWQACTKIQKEEGYEVTSEPSEDGKIPFLDVDSFVKTLRDEENKLVDAMSCKNAIKLKIETQEKEINTTNTESDQLKKESAAIREDYEITHRVELERTSRNEVFLAELEKERDEVRLLNTSLNELKTTTRDELEGMRRTISEQEGKIEKKRSHLDKLKCAIAENGTAIDENTSLFEQEKAKSAAKLEKNKLDVEAAKETFEKVRGEIEALRNSCDEELQREIEEIEKAQSIMTEEIELNASRLLKEHPDLEGLEYQFDSSLSAEERINSSLSGLKQVCEERINDFREKQKQFLSEIRQARQEQQQRLDKEREEKERVAREAREKRKLEKDRDEREKKEKRRLAREEKRRKKEELERLAAVGGKQDKLEKVAATEKKVKAALVRKQRKRIDFEPLIACKGNQEVEEGTLQTKRTKYDAKSDKFLSNKHEKSTTISFYSDVEANPPKECKNSENDWTGFDELPLSLDNDENENAIADGCLTQRPGLDIPAPKSLLSDDDSMHGKECDRDKISWERSATSKSHCEPSYRAERIKVCSLEMEPKDLVSGNIHKQKMKPFIRSKKTGKSSCRGEATDGVKELSKKSKLCSTHRNTRETRNSWSRKRLISKEDQIGTGSLTRAKKDISQKKNHRGNTSLDRPKKDDKAKSDRSTGTKGSYRSQSSNRKRTRRETAKPIQTSGISSGERLSKSRRRKPQGSDHTSRKAKPVSVGILGDMGNDFNFNF